MHPLIQSAKACDICAPHLPHGPRPVFSIHPHAGIVIVGQAPGRKVHQSGIPWHDASGRRLRQWLGVDDATFYNPEYFAILPMGFCYPGTGRSGDLPPRPECAPKWHDALLALMPHVRLTLLFGQYALERYLGDRREPNLTETVRSWQAYLPEYLPLPHPSPRNLVWQKKNPWFEKEVLPYLKTAVREVLQQKR